MKRSAMRDGPPRISLRSTGLPIASRLVRAYNRYPYRDWSRTTLCQQDRARLGTAAGGAAIWRLPGAATEPLRLARMETLSTGKTLSRWREVAVVASIIWA